MPKIGSCKIFGRPNFYGGSQYTHISIINVYKFIKIRHDIINQCHGNHKEMKKFNYKLEIEIFKNSTQQILGVLRGSFKGFGCPKRRPDALLAKTMLSVIYYDAQCSSTSHLRVDVLQRLSPGGTPHWP